MNENINLVELLKGCPQGTKLYSTIYGEVEFKEIIGGSHPIVVLICYKDKYSDEIIVEDVEFTSKGLYHDVFKDAECTLFPSKDQRDWSKWKCPKPKFDPKTLKPFDRVLVRNEKRHSWGCELFSHTSKNADYSYVAIRISYKYCIPYNDDTKHLVGTSDEATEYYRYWEN